MRLDGKVAVVTGGASGIGRATALRFLDEGARLVVADLNEAAGAETAELAARAGHRARIRFVRVDVAAEAEVEGLLALAVRDFGRVDCVFNNAGIGGAFGSVMRTAVEDWDYTFGVLVRGAFLGIKHGARAMVAGGIQGSIINTASVAGFSGGDAPIAYSSAKAAVINMTRAAAVELARHRIRVNCLCPGAISTPLLRRGIPDEDPERALERMQPWPEAGRGEDVAGAALFLASDDARFVTGAALVVDGGLLAAGPRLGARLRGSRAGDPSAADSVGLDLGSTGLGPLIRSRD
jgi:NAD(P)-dependent dehydrogenase (short-subunit alcohol dehydrogenase family)